MRRRTFIHNGALLIGASSNLIGKEAGQSIARFGLVTDLHHADKTTRGTRHYRETLSKLEEAGKVFAKTGLDHVVELGDFIDSASSLTDEKKHLATVQKKFTELPGKKHYVLGNHCVHMLKKQEFLEGVEREKSYYSFDHTGWHFVVLDSCFRSDGVPYERNNFQWTDPNIPAAELEWLRADLAGSKQPTIVFAHQRLDLANHYAVKNAPAVREILENSGQVRAVFQGHSHKNDLKEIGDIPYVTLVAMVEGSGETNNGYSRMNIFEDGTLMLDGFRKQQSHKLIG